MSLFYTTYDDVRGYDPLPPSFATEPVPHLRTGLKMVNNISEHTYGFEVSGNWRPLDTLTLHANYSYLQLTVDEAPGLPPYLYDSYEGRSPDSLYSVTVNWAPQNSVDLGMALYGSSKLEQLNNPVPAYLRCDLRVTWRPVHGVEFSLVGQNLLDSSHAEFPTADKVLTSEISRSVYLGATFDF
jgi:iron complex outermembrane receptor protein